MPAAREQRLDGGLRPVERRGDLAHRQIVEVVQDQRGPLQRRQTSKRAEDEVPLLGGRGGDRPVGGPVADEEAQTTALFPMLTPKVVDEPVLRDRADPRHRVGATIESVPAPNGLHERLLRQLLRDLPDAAAAVEDVAEHRRQGGVVPGAEPPFVLEQRAELSPFLLLDSRPHAASLAPVPRVICRFVVPGPR